jgi:hypothetical protein
LHPACAQSELVLHWTQPRKTLHTGFEPVHAVCVPLTQAFEGPQVWAEVKTLFEQEAPRQSELVLHWTQPRATLHAGVAPVHATCVPLTQAFVEPQVWAAVKTLF